jgi:hypothetical protein
LPPAPSPGQRGQRGRRRRGRSGRGRGHSGARGDSGSRPHTGLGRTGCSRSSGRTTRSPAPLREAGCPGFGFLRARTEHTVRAPLRVRRSSLRASRRRPVRPMD